MTVISVGDLSLSFGTFKVLDRVSFSLEENDKLGIVGVNGCGKSSLFKLITGEYEPEHGSVFISKDKTVDILTQEGAFDLDEDSLDRDSSVLLHMYKAFPELSRLEDRLAEITLLLESATDDARERLTHEYSDLNDRFISNGGLEYKARCRSTLQKLGFDDHDVNSPISSLSGGQKTRLALAVRLAREPDILMLDEPTNHLDTDTLVWLENFLSSYKKCVMIISHDRYFLDRVTNKTLAISHSHAKLYNGNYTRSLALREADREAQEKAYKIQQCEIARQEAYIAQQRAWNRERNIIAAESRQKLLDKMERVERPEDDPKSIRMRFDSAISSGNDVLYIRRLAMAYPGKPLFEGLDFLVKKNDRLLIVGPNGCGKSTFIKMLMGKLSPTKGTAEFGYNVVIGYYDQENQNLDPESTVLDELWNAYPRKTETEIRNTLSLFRFIGENVYKSVSMLSGGEKARLTLSKLMLSKMNLLILDEPTNHLDINSREALEEALCAFDGTIIAVSHDRYFINKIATRIIELKPQPPFTGDMLDYNVSRIGDAYTEFKDYKAARSAETVPTSDNVQKAPVTGSKEDYLQSKQKLADERKRLNRIKTLEANCKKYESELEDIEKELFGDASTDYKKAAELDARKTELEDMLMEAYEELENLNL